MSRAQEIYDGSNGTATTAYYRDLEALGTVGVIAVNLFRAQKCSHRAKTYRRRSSKGAAYDRKNWSISNLCAILLEHATTFGIVWGWKRDDKTGGYPWVLYVDIPNTGQVSFHSPDKLAGPSYDGEWSGLRNSAELIVQFCDNLMATKQPEVETFEVTSDVHSAIPEQLSLL